MRISAGKAAQITAFSEPNAGDKETHRHPGRRLRRHRKNRTGHEWECNARNNKGSFFHRGFPGLPN
jgi:hypothetical protein